MPFNGYQWARYLIVFALSIVILWLTWRVKAVFAPFFVALILAYLLEPLVMFLERKGISRLVALLYIYSAMIFMVVVLVCWGMPRLVTQINEMLQILPQYIDQVQGYLNYFESQYAKAQLPTGIKDAIASHVSDLEQVAIALLGKFVDGLANLASHLLEVVLIPILAFYFIKDKQYLQNQLWKLIPIKSRGELGLLWQEINWVLHGFLLGSVIVASIVALLTTIGLMVVGMDFALLFGITAGVFNVIPYFGPIIGMVPAVTFALMSSTKLALIVFLIMVAVQQIESNFISPKIIGEKIGVHPIVIIFALLAGGKLLGFWGLLFAVPIAGILKVVLLYIINKTIRLGEKNQ